MTDVLEYLHGSYNGLVMILFFYQGWLGISIRRARRSKAPLPLKSVRRHRKMGPALALLGGLGFLFGLILVLINSGRVLEFPRHFFVGLAIVVFLTSTFLVSRKIKRPDSPFRTPHFGLGLLVLLLYIIQSFLGVRVLF